jgi:hypothetical protein
MTPVDVFYMSLEASRKAFASRRVRVDDTVTAKRGSMVTTTEIYSLPGPLPDLPPVTVSS